MNLPFAREAMAKAVLARPAREDDDPSEVLVIGRDFHYLVLGEGDELAKTDQAGGPMNAPDRVVVDADSFLSGLGSQFRDIHTAPPAGTLLIAIHATDGRAFRVDPTA